MIAMLLAAQLSAEIMHGVPADQLTTIKLVPAWRQAFEPQAACPSQGALQTSDPATPALLLRPQDRKTIRLRKLGDLPKANKEIAVLRSVDGCAVPVGIRYSVEGDGKFANGGGQ
jgi:hypothetical protein